MPQMRSITAIQLWGDKDMGQQLPTRKGHLWFLSWTEALRCTACHPNDADNYAGVGQT